MDELKLWLCEKQVLGVIDPNKMKKNERNKIFSSCFGTGSGTLDLKKQLIILRIR